MSESKSDMVSGYMPNRVSESRSSVLESMSDRVCQDLCQMSDRLCHDLCQIESVHLRIHVR